ncbi:hypothetical protein AAE478_009386 [Parahypoxylon ruwenzoriense]
MAHLELFVLTWGIYPRRILIYLHEKGLLHSQHIKVTPVTLVPSSRDMVAPGKPPGTVPILALPDGTFIKQSVAILEYFEDICDNPQEDWQKDIAAAAKRPSMRGNSARDRATTREMLALADEATALFGVACYLGSRLFVPAETTTATGWGVPMSKARKNLKLLEAHYASRDINSPAIFTADCVLISLLQFSKELYGVDLTADPELPMLKRFFDAFKERESAKIPEDFYPKEFRELACVWVK